MRLRTRQGDRSDMYPGFSRQFSRALNASKLLRAHTSFSGSSSGKLHSVLRYCADDRRNQGRFAKTTRAYDSRDTTQSYMKKESDVLNDLIETLKDGQEGFRQAAENVRDPQLKTLFSQYSQQRSRFATALQ